MQYTKFKSTLLSFAAFTVSTASQIAIADTQLGYDTSEVADGIYMLSGTGGFTGGNIGLSVGEDGVVMIDDGIANVSDTLKATVAKISDKKIDYLINTHLHGDHTGNNESFSDDANIISHDNVRTGLIKQQRPAGALPVLTFSKQMTIHLNGDAAKVIHFANAHTDGDAVIHFTKGNVIHTGDILFHQRFPFIDAPNGGSVQGLIAALKAIHAMSDDDTKIIPGHGPLASKATIAIDIAMLENTLSTVSALVAEGKTDAEIAAAKPLASYASYSWGFIDTDKMLAQLIKGARK